VNVLNAGTARLLQPYSRPLIRNAWYCAAWSEEVSTDLFSRRVLNAPLLLYRKENGDPVALLDICPHKLAPLHMGIKVGDAVQCGYHGLEFDSTGRCIRNPQGNGQIPSEAKLRSYPLVERYGVLWVWMGDAERADPNKIPDFKFLVDPKRRTQRGHHGVNCNYMMLVENLMDLGHAMFLHRQTGGVTDPSLAENKVEQEEDEVRDLRLHHDKPAPALFLPYLNSVTNVDFWTDIRWNAPAMVLNDVGCAPSGRGRDAAGLTTLGAHFLTPETQHTTRYFYAHSRNWAQDNAQIDEMYWNWQRNALKAEDSRVSEAIDSALSDAMNLEVRMVMLSTDQSGLRVNRVLDRMAAAEARRENDASAA
jgi:phenylpropionate dioxygenase-like ring-hydroxylating dioxygenase large terminal subunit